jgi:hypothetical protein
MLSRRKLMAAIAGLPLVGLLAKKAVAHRAYRIHPDVSKRVYENHRAMQTYSFQRIRNLKSNHVYVKLNGEQDKEGWMFYIHVGGTVGKSDGTLAWGYQRMRPDGSQQRVLNKDIMTDITLHGPQHATLLLINEATVATGSPPTNIMPNRDKALLEFAEAGMDPAEAAQEYVALAVPVTAAQLNEAAKHKESVFSFPLVSEGDLEAGLRQ